MSHYESMPRPAIVRNRDRAMIAGVCAGLADYFGFNLKATRFLAAMALLFAMPMTLLAYFCAVFLLPSVSGNSRRPGRDEDFLRAVRSEPTQTITDVRRRYRSLDGRLARLERYVTSSKFDLDQEFRKL